jgi:hypothetical protein
VSAHTVPPGPIGTAPSVGRYVDPACQLEVLHRAVTGVPLELSDEDVLAWLAECEWETVAAIASLIVRARRAGGTP